MIVTVSQLTRKHNLIGNAHKTVTSSN